jgi:hypothetical protein
VHDLHRSGLDSVDTAQFSLGDGFGHGFVDGFVDGFADSLGATVI